MGENSGRKLHTHADIHAVGIGMDIQITTYLLHPFAAAPSCGNYTFFSLITGIPVIDPISLLQLFHLIDKAVKMKIHVFFQMII